MRIVCAGHLVRYPLGGHSWHHLQYLVGLLRLGHDVVFFEDYGWPDSCFDPARGEMTSDPSYGIAFLRELLEPHGLGNSWCYLGEDGTEHGMSRERLAELLADCDLFLNLSNVNWIPELERCRRRALVDTDPLFTQIGAHGMRVPFDRYQVRFTYGENVHRPGCEIPTDGVRWLPTRQPVVLDLWSVEPGDAGAPLTTVINWTAWADCEYNGRVYGQKNREFEPFFSLPRELDEPMEIAVAAPDDVKERLADGGWRVASAHAVTREPQMYQAYLRGSRAEFGVAKHGYVASRCGWFSDRSSAYLASGRPVVVEDTGFSDFLPCGEGLLSYQTPPQAIAAIHRLGDDYEAHCRAARSLAEEEFDSRRVLEHLLEHSL